MDDKDKFITVTSGGKTDDSISEKPEDNGLPNNDSAPSDNNIEGKTSQPTETSSTINGTSDHVRKYDSFMYEPIGFEKPKSKTDYNFMDNSPEIQKTKNDRMIVKSLFALFGIIIVATTACIAFDVVRSPKAFENYTPAQQVVLYKSKKPVSDSEATKADKNGKYTTEGVAAAVRPSIVEIYTYSDKSHKELESTGSGIVISEDGYIVTNAHVIGTDHYYVIKTSDGKSYDAVVVGKDKKTDIAVVKIDAKNMKAAVLGDSDDVAVGEQVMAIGNPAGLSGTVTSGIVSAVNRKIKGDATSFEMNCIQTNADISPGNSGGALVNMYGQVIGITSSKYVSSSYEGLGFAITINEASPIIEELIKNGFVKGRFRVGITFIGTDTDVSRAAIEEALKDKKSDVKMPEDFNGLYVVEISKDSDISKTDLEVGDFITQIGDKKVSNYDELYDALKSYDTNDTITAKCAKLGSDGVKSTYEIKFHLMEDKSGNY